MKLDRIIPQNFPYSAGSVPILCLALPNRVICASPGSIEITPLLLIFANFVIKENSLLLLKFPHVLLVLPVPMRTLSD